MKVMTTVQRAEKNMCQLEKRKKTVTAIHPRKPHAVQVMQKKWNVSHHRQRLLRKGQTRYKRPMRRKTSLSSTTDSTGEANNSQIHTGSSARLVTSYRNNNNFPAENHSITNASLEEIGRSSTSEGWYRSGQPAHSTESRNGKEEALQNGEVVSLEESERRDMSGQNASYNSPGSENAFVDRMPHSVRIPNSRLPMHTKDTQFQTLIFGVTKQTEKQSNENHHSFNIRNALSEHNKNILANESAYNSSTDNLSDKQHDDVPTITPNNHRGAGWNFSEGETGKIELLNETDHYAPPLDLQRKRAHHPLTAAANLHTGTRVYRKVNNTLSQPARSGNHQDTENYSVEEVNHTEGSVISKGLPDNSQKHLVQKIGEQPVGTANTLQVKNQEAALGNTTTHKLRHERRRKTLARQQSNPSRHLNLTSENTNGSQSPNISHPTYNVYNFYGPVIFTNGALPPLNSNDSLSSKESGALNTFSNVVSNQASNTAKSFNSAHDGMSMVFLPTSLVSRLLLQTYSSNMNSVGTLQNVPFSGPSTSSHYGNPSFLAGGGSGPSYGWSGGTHQRPADFGTVVDEYNRGTGYTGNGHSFSGGDPAGFGNVGTGNPPVNFGNAHTDNTMLHPGAWSPPYNAPTIQGSDIPGGNNPGAQWSGYTGATIDPNGMQTDITGTAHVSTANNAPLSGGRDPGDQGLSVGQSSDTLNIVINGSHSNVSSTGITVNYDSPATEYQNGDVNANSSQGTGSSNHGGNTSDNFAPGAPVIPNGVGGSFADSSPNQGTNFGPVPGDTSFTGAGSQQETGWKVRGRIGFEWSPEHSGSIDGGSFYGPPENRWRDYRPSYDPTMGAQAHDWLAPPFPDWRYSNAYPPFRDQGYGSYSGAGNPPWDYMPPPYTGDWTPGSRRGYMWLEGDIWRDHGAPDYTPPQDLQPTSYSGASYPSPASAAYSPGSPRSGLPLSHSAASLVGGVPFGASRRAPSGHYSSRRPAHSNQYYRPRPGGSYNPNLLHSLG